MAWEMGAKNKAGLERGRKALSNAGDPKDDCRSCGHARDAHSGKTCSQCYSGRKYSHTFTEKGQAPVSLGDLENARPGAMQWWGTNADRKKFLKEAGKDERYADLTWNELPEDVQEALQDALSKDDRLNTGRLDKIEKGWVVETPLGTGVVTAVESDGMWVNLQSDWDPSGKGHWFKVPNVKLKNGLSRGLALTAGVTDGGCGSRLNHCGSCIEDVPGAGGKSAMGDAIPSEGIRHPQDTIPMENADRKAIEKAWASHKCRKCGKSVTDKFRDTSAWQAARDGGQCEECWWASGYENAKEGQSPCPRSYSEEHVFMPSGEGKQQCDLCGKTRTQVEGTLGKWRENDLGGLGMVERENAACPHCQHEGSEHGETGVCGQCDCLGAARYENEQGVCRCGHSQANHQDNGQGSDTSCLQCFDAKKCGAYSERKNAAGGDPGKKWAAMDRTAREKALEAAGLYKGYWLQELDEIHTPHAKKLAEVLERENAAGWAEYKSPLSEHKGPWECDECGARLATDADVRSHKMDTGHSSYKSRKNSAELDNAWKCLECGRKFKDAAAAERATFSDSGCPGCGGSDIDDVVENSYKVKALCDTCAAKAMKSGGRLQDSIPGAGIERCDECRGGGPLLMVELKNGVTKRAWVHLQDPSKPQTGRISCPCGQAPESVYGDGKDVHCPCGRAYDSRGWILEGPELENADAPEGECANCEHKKEMHDDGHCSRRGCACMEYRTGRIPHSGYANSTRAGVSRGFSRYGSPRLNSPDEAWESSWDKAQPVLRKKWLRKAGLMAPSDAESPLAAKAWSELSEDSRFELGKAAMRGPIE